MRTIPETKKVMSDILHEVSKLYLLPAIPNSEFITELMKRAFEAGYDAAEVDALNSHRLSSKQ
jgi:hypothetical protein